MQQNFDINVLRKEAQNRWLKPSEVLFILQNHENYEITSEPPQKPPSGSLFLFNRRVLRFFRKDGHSWRRKKDGRAVGEAHERLKVRNVEALNCYYAHGDQNPYFQRRSYWMLNPAYEHIVLVHYREVSEGRYVTAQNSNFNQTSSNSNTSNLTSSAGEVSSKIETQNPKFANSNRISTDNNNINNNINSNNSNNDNNNSRPELNQALRHLAVQLSLEDYDDYIYLQEKLPQNTPQNENSYDLTKFRGENGAKQSSVNFKLETKGSPSWKDMLELSSDSVGINIASNSNVNLFEKDRFLNSSQYIEPKETWQQNTENQPPKMDKTELQLQLSATRRFLLGSDSIDSPSKTLNDNQTLNLIDDQTLTLNGNQSQTLLRKYSSNEWMKDFVANFESNDNNNNGNIKIGDSDFSNSWFDQGQPSFCIMDISPEWAFSSEKTKVIITGNFQSDPSDPLQVSFGEILTPAEIIQEGVLRCFTPPQIAPGKIPLFIKNRDSVSQIRDFEIRDSNSQILNINNEELSLLLNFARLILGKTEGKEGLVGIVEELLREKLGDWLEMKARVLTKREMGIIHFIAGLGFEWALSPVLEAGVGINFRDANGWTALHWAAYFGREKTVAALLAQGASSTAVTDPTPLSPLGLSPAHLAQAQAHLGLAAYLSQFSLSSHLSLLTLATQRDGRADLAGGNQWAGATRDGRADLAGGSQWAGATRDGRADLAGGSQWGGDRRDGGAELAGGSQWGGATRDGGEGTGEVDQSEGGMEEAMGEVRKAVEAAGRIQAAFRAFSFRRRRENSLVKEDPLYGISQEDLNEISSKLHMRKNDKDRAALSIQKRYRGWKGRRNFLTVRKHVVKIQAVVRGHQVRTKYRELIWTVSVIEKAVLRWRRKGHGLRGFRRKMTETPLQEESGEESGDSEEEDIGKVFRREKVDNALEEAVRRVFGIVESPDARLQYRRMIQRFREAKEEMINNTEETAARLRDESEIIDTDDFMY